MKQSDRQLLLADLYSRIQYGVKFKSEDEECADEIDYIRDEEVYSKKYKHLCYWIDTVKPYLRPISSMTRKEDAYYQYYIHIIGEGIVAVGDSFCIGGFFEWLNSHHFDYRGLIQKGLALEAPENMYKID